MKFVRLSLASVFSFVMLSTLCNLPANAQTILTFQQGIGAYTGTQDTEIRFVDPDTNLSSEEGFSADADTTNTGLVRPAQSLIRFDSIFGNGVGQIPQHSSIVSATLVLESFDPAGGLAIVNIGSLLT